MIIRKSCNHLGNGRSRAGFFMKNLEWKKWSSLSSFRRRDSEVFPSNERRFTGGSIIAMDNFHVVPEGSEFL